MIEALPEAQHLALVAIHLDLEPYRLWNRGLTNLPPHPRPREYRALLYAMALWYEERLDKRTEAMPLIFAGQLGLLGKPKRKKPGVPRRRLAPKYPVS